MYAICDGVECDQEKGISLPIQIPAPTLFELEDRSLVQSFIDRFCPLSCEYNFSNLFCWQRVYNYSWFIYQDRLLVFDGMNKCLFMPLGQEFSPEEMSALSQYLMEMGLEPDIGNVPREYIDAFPDIERFYNIQEERDNAEYIYRVDSLFQLKGVKLHKKRNLISQFKRSYPDFKAIPMKGKDLETVFSFAQNLFESRKSPSKTLIDEFSAMKKAFAHFESLGLEGMMLEVKNQLVAFSIFSRLNHDTYNIQFEKSDIAFKGAAQVINQETAGYLMDKCLYVNREQDLGIKGLRRAKLSYEPEQLLIPYSLKFKGNI